MNDTQLLTRPTPENASDEAGLSIVSIAKSYDNRVVLSDVSLSVGRGEVVGLLGPNGAGKTTCFYSVMGLVKPDSGRILLDGADITTLPMYRRNPWAWLFTSRNLNFPGAFGCQEYQRGA